MHRGSHRRWPGIAAEFLPRVFLPFEQREGSYSRKGGLGLGLAICKMIVTLHGGSITARSEGKDRERASS